MPAVNPLKVADVCHAPLSLRYWQPVMVTNVMLLVVLEASIGAAGAACVALATADVAADVIPPVQLAAVTVTVMVWPMSAATNLYVDDVAPEIFAVPRFHW